MKTKTKKQIPLPKPIKENENFLLWVTLFLFAVSLYIFKDFLYIILVSVILSLSTRSLYIMIEKKLKKYKKVKKHISLLTSIIITLLFSFMIFFPFIYFVVYSYTNYSSMITHDNLTNTIKIIIDKATHLPESLSFAQDTINVAIKNFEISDINGSFVSHSVSYILTILKSINNVIMELFMILFFYFLINLYGKTIKSFVFSFMPINKLEKQKIFNEFSNTSAVVLYGTVFSMVAQGLAFGILIAIYSLIFGNIYGIEIGYNALYLGIMAGFLSVIPVVGAALVYFPIVLIEWFAGHHSGAIFIFLYSVVFMGTIIDNIFKVMFISYISDKLKFKYSLSEMMILLSMIAGISVFGFWGIIIGPSIIALTISSSNLYKRLHLDGKV